MRALPVRVAVDGATWTNGRGYGRFTREILTAAARITADHELVLVMDATPLQPPPPQIRMVQVPVRVPATTAASADSRRSFRDLWAMGRALAAVRADLIFFPSVYTFTPVPSRAPVIVTIHDVIPERLPEHVFSSRRGRWFWSMKVRAAVYQATKIVTVSEHARSGVIERLGIAPERIRVVPEAPAPIFNAQADVEGGREALRAAGCAADCRFVLYVGGIAPHKNLGALVDAVGSLSRRPAFADVKLLVVGEYVRDPFYSAYPALRAHADAHVPGRVIWMGAVPDAAVAGLMRLSETVVLPSLEEGFGLPAIEAAACGAAVIVTERSAMPELLGDAAVYINPADPASLPLALEHLLGDADLRQRLGSRAAARAATHTWEASARRLLAVFDECRS